LEKENVYLREELRTEHNFEEIVGNSPALLKALHVVDQVAPTDFTVLIYGETGTGKELVARAIHSRNLRNGRALVNVNCSAYSSESLKALRITGKIRKTRFRRPS
jgi:formate hydrogenlyase transcriptional activator